jgi:hypothetical protein
MIDAEAAASAARIALQDLRGRNHDAAIAAAATANAGRAVFVRRLDQPERSYFLVPWHDARGVVLVVQVDTNGEMRSLAVFPKPVDHLVIPKEKVRSLVAASSDRTAGDPELVWWPCRESTSPLQPLYRVPIGGGELYVTADGSIRERLTPLSKGG